MKTAKPKAKAKAKAKALAAAGIEPEQPKKLITERDDTRKLGRLAALTGGGSIVPLAVLFGLNFVDEFDRLAFAALTPELRNAFNLSDAGITAVGTFSGLLVLFAALPIGWLGDRISRVRMAMISAAIWGTMSIATGLVPTVWALFVVRLIAGIGRLSNESIHPSLLADYYPPSAHPSVFRIHRFANPIAGVAGIIAGLIAASIGWEWAFILLSIPTFLFILAAAALKEPIRGESIDKELAEKVHSTEGTVPFGEARRQLYNVRTLRRLWTGALFLGVGWVPIGAILSLFFENVYRYDARGRGLVVFFENAGVAIGLVVGGWFATRVVRRDATQHLATITGLSFVLFAVGLLLMAVVPNAPASVAFATLGSVGIGGFQPAYFSLVGLVAPPRIRSQAFSWAVLYVGLGGLGAIVLIEFADNEGYRLAVGLLSGIIALAGMIGVTAFRFVRRDIEQATKTMETAIRLKDELKKLGSQQSLVVCRGVEVSYDQVQVLFGVDLEVKEGEILALLGTNGAGKSTLLKAISGLVDPIGGAIFYDGRDITHADATKTAQLGIVQMPGGRAVFPTLSVKENLRLAAWLFRGDNDRFEEELKNAEEMFPILRDRKNELAGSLSGGEQQMLSLAGAFMNKPKLLMIDELSLGLAPTIVGRLIDVVQQIHKTGVTIIVVEQSVNVALTLAERAIFLEKGEVRFSGKARELLDRPDILRSVFIAGASAQGAKKKPSGNGARSKANQKAVTTAPMKRVAPPPNAPVVLECREVMKRFGGITAVNGVNLELKQGQILGLIGANGAGKTTLFDCISGFIPIDSGRINVGGEDVSEKPPHERAKLGLGRSFQEARLYPTLTVAETIAVALERHLASRDILAAAMSLPASYESELQAAERVEELIELMGLTAFREKLVGELSTGSRRIVELACTLAQDPSIMLLDEPSGGVAQRETEALGPLLQRIQQLTGCSMMVIEHDMPLMSAICDEMIALELGGVIATGTPKEVLNHPAVVESYLGTRQEAIQRSGAGSTRGRSRTRGRPR
jgi:branched-chain amino acid transport system ATP-binding protein